MALTNFPNGVSSFGVPVLGEIPSGGNRYFVDPVNGLDSNEGTDWDSAFQSLSQAHSVATAGNHDVVFLQGNGAADGSARESETLTWSKDATHLIGVGSPAKVANRSRIAATSGTTFTPLITFSADGCVWAGIHAFHGYNTAEAQICLDVTGQRNVFVNCHFAGMGHATAGDQAGSSSVSLTGDGENYFKDCTIGIDTIARSTTNAEIDFKSAAVRNVFENCEIVTFADNAGHLFIKADSSGDLDRFTIFRNCLFINAVASTATTMTAATDVHSSAGGMLVMYDCCLIGATDWEAADSTNIYLYGGGMQSSGNLLTGIAHTVDVS